MLWFIVRIMFLYSNASIDNLFYAIIYSPCEKNASCTRISVTSQVSIYIAGAFQWKISYFSSFFSFFPSQLSFPLWIFRSNWMLLNLSVNQGSQLSKNIGGQICFHSSSSVISTKFLSIALLLLCSFFVVHFFVLFLLYTFWYFFLFFLFSFILWV